MLEMLVCSGAYAYGAFTMWGINHFRSEEDRIIISGVRPENDCFLLTGHVYECVFVKTELIFTFLMLLSWSELQSKLLGVTVPWKP